MDDSAALILDKETIQRKLRRMAYEIYEFNSNEKELILAGVLERGQTVATQLAKVLNEIAPFSLKLLEINLNRSNPLEVSISEEMDFTGKVVIVVDDVANSGRTLFYAMKPVLSFLPKKIQTAVLINRMHKSFPISVNYVGHSLSTTLQENVLVEVAGPEIKGAYLQ